MGRGSRVVSLPTSIFGNTQGVAPHFQVFLKLRFLEHANLHHPQVSAPSKLLQRVPLLLFPLRRYCKGGCWEHIFTTTFLEISKKKCLGADIYCSIYAMIHFTHRWCTQRKPFSECLKFPQIQGCGALISFGATFRGASQALRWDCPPALSPGLANG